MYALLSSNFAAFESPSNLQNHVVPQISGDLEIDQSLVVVPGQWSSSTEVVLSYQWYADGNPLSGETTSNLVLSESLQGKTVFVSEIARDDFGVRSVNSSTVTIPSLGLSFIEQPMLSPAQGVVGDSFTLDFGQVDAGNPINLVIEFIELDGVDVLSGVQGTVWSSAEFSAGNLRFQTRAIDMETGEFVLSNIIEAEVTGNQTSVDIYSDGQGNIIFDVDEEIGTISISGSNVESQNGVFPFNRVDLEDGPVNIVPVSWLNRTAPGQAPKAGDVVEKIDGLWLFSLDHGIPIVIHDWELNGQKALAEPDGSLIINVEQETVGGLGVSEKATNASGSVSNSVYVLPPKILPNHSVQVSNGHLDTGVIPTNSLAFLLVFAGRRIIGNDLQNFFGSHQWFRAQFANDGNLWTAIKRSDGSRTAWGATSLVQAGDQFRLIMSLELGRALQASVSVNGGDWITFSATDASADSLLQMTAASSTYKIGQQNGSAGLNSEIERLAYWELSASPDLLDEAVRRRFFTENDQLLSPEVGNYYYGQPLIDVFGPASNYLNLVNHGTGSSFAQIEGDWVDV